jgi:hypothetical protein
MAKSNCYYWIPETDKIYICQACDKKSSRCYIKKHDRTYNVRDPVHSVRYKGETYLYRFSHFGEEEFNTDAFITKRGLKIE